MPEIREHNVDVHRVNALNVDRDWVEVHGGLLELIHIAVTSINMICCILIAAYAGSLYTPRSGPRQDHGRPPHVHG